MPEAMAQAVAAVSDYMPAELEAMLKRQHYALFGHSAVKLCHWTKCSLTRGEVCYKQKFYGISSHRCLQMTPAVSWCQQQCVFCWRPFAKLGFEIPHSLSPEEIAEKSIELQRRLLSGFGALREQIGETKLRETNNPNQVAISLSGEPTLYPDLSGLIEEYHKRDFTTFLVSNGLRPRKIAELSMPTQLYISLDAPDKATHKRINSPLVPDSWELINETLSLFPSLGTRKVIRVTLVRGINMCNEQEYARLISKAEPDFVELKAYMFVGYSRKRLKEQNMPSHAEVREFAERVNNELGYNFAAESEPSRVVMLWNGRTRMKITAEG